MWMLPDDFARFEKLPQSVRVYRKCCKGGEKGWSWTLSRDIAELFPVGEPWSEIRVIEGLVQKSKIVGLFTNSHIDEQEIVVAGDDVVIDHIE